jgi:hypothetical protein
MSLKDMWIECERRLAYFDMRRLANGLIRLRQVHSQLLRVKENNVPPYELGETIWTRVP